MFSLVITSAEIFIPALLIKNNRQFRSADHWTPLARLERRNVRFNVKNINVFILCSTGKRRKILNLTG